MSDKQEGISPISPLEKNEPEPEPAEGATNYPGYEERPTGRKFLRFPKVPPPNGHPKSKPPGGAA